MKHCLRLTPRDPIIARDGRPFGLGQGRRMRSLDWPYSTVLAGSLRTLLGELSDFEFNAAQIEDLKKIEIAGPLPMVDKKLFVPAPRDLLVTKRSSVSSAATDRNLLVLRPGENLSPGEGCDFPEKGMSPILATEPVDELSKPLNVPAFWSLELMERWLTSGSCLGFEIPLEKSKIGGDFLDIPKKEYRVHVKIDSDSGTADEGMLFVTAGLCLDSDDPSHALSMAARVDTNSGNELDETLRGLDSLHSFGGERRLLHWKGNDSEEAEGVWEPSEVVLKTLGAVADGQGIRMVLASPAVFEKGWIPGWLNGDLVGEPPDTHVQLRLVGAIIDRWKPISGWSLEIGNTGPKPVNRMVPAGSVYFFEKMSGDASCLARKLWLKSACDNERNRCDGFGLSLWGVWNRSS